MVIFGAVSLKSNLHGQKQNKIYKPHLLLLKKLYFAPAHVHQMVVR